MRRNKRAPGKAYYISLDEEILSFGNVVWSTPLYFFCLHVLLNLNTLYTSWMENRRSDGPEVSKVCRWRQTFDHDAGELIRTLEQVLAGRSWRPRLLSAGASHFQHSHSLSLLKLCDPRSQRALLKSVSVKLSSTSLQTPSLSPLSKRSVTKHSSPGCSQGRC